MFGGVGETQYDLRFSLFGIPVRVHPLFFLVAALLGWSPGWAEFVGVSPVVLVLHWIVCVFVSILVHELGHALTAKAMGYPPEIVLYHFGGFARYVPVRNYTLGREVAISFAGPLAGFILCGVIYLLQFAMTRTFTDAALMGLVYDEEVSRKVFYILIQFKFVNLWWGILNLMPIQPLDGGHITGAICQKLNPHKGEQIALWISVIMGGLIALYLLTVEKRTYAGVMFAVLAYFSYQRIGRRPGIY